MEQTSYFQIASQPFQITPITHLQLHLSRAALTEKKWALIQLFKFSPGV